MLLPHRFTYHPSMLFPRIQLHFWAESRAYFAGGAPVLQDHTHVAHQDFLHDAGRDRLPGDVCETVLLVRRGQIASVPDSRLPDPWTVHGVDAHSPHEPTHRFGRWRYWVCQEERAVEETGNAGMLIILFWYLLFLYSWKKYFLCRIARFWLIKNNCLWFI